jgi:hypothetical protein
MCHDLEQLQLRAVSAAYHEVEKIRELAADPSLTGHRAVLVEVADRLAMELFLVQYGYSGSPICPAPATYVPMTAVQHPASGR